MKSVPVHSSRKLSVHKKSQKLSKEASVCKLGDDDVNGLIDNFYAKSRITHLVHFFVTGLYMQFWDWFVEGIKKRKVSLLIPNILTVEGGFLLVVLGVLFYIFREKRMIQIVILLIISAAVCVLNHGGIQWLMCGASIPMLLYNGKRGKGLKQFFYIFYPAHLIVLYLIATVL